MSKKSQGISMEFIIIAAILLVVFVVVVVVFTGLFGTEGRELNKNIEGTKDSDGDGVVDFIDKCDSGAGGLPEYSGCQNKDELDKAIASKKH